MPYGIHSFYVFPTLHNRVHNHENYFIGRFIGDHWNDEEFASKLKRIEQKIKEKYGSNCTFFWSPGIVRAIKRLTVEQRYGRAVSKASNIHKNNVLKILQDNTLFVDDFLCEEINRYHARVEVLRKRYQDIAEDEKINPRYMG